MHDAGFYVAVTFSLILFDVFHAFGKDVFDLFEDIEMYFEFKIFLT